MQLEPQLVSIRNTARILSIGLTKTYELISDGVLDTVSIGTRRLVTTDSIRRLIERAQMDGDA
jgi:hypothetical protein